MQSVSKQEMIIGFGDGITYGYGVEKSLSYPKLIETKTGVKITNAGVVGELSSAGLLRLPSILEQKPDLVILCHGVHDIYNKSSEKILKDNILSMVKLIQNSGSKVLLIGVPNLAILSNDIHHLYDEVAQETGVSYDNNILRNILSHHMLKQDYIHPNEDGYEILANSLIHTLHLDE